MSLEHYYSTVNAMVNEGRFEHIGRATIRVEGASAWGVWLRVDHWPSALGRHPRLRCGVLFHVANRTLSFHGIGSDAVQFLLPLFESWTYSSLPQLPSLRTRPVSSSVPPLDDPHPPAISGSNTPLPQNRPESSEVSSLRGLVQQLVELCRGNQSLISHLRDEVSQLRAQFASHLGSHTRPDSTPPPPPPPPSPPVPRPRGSSVRQCRHSNCANNVPPRCPVGFCRAHCTSPRCQDHADGRRPRECRARGCHAVVPRSCASGFCVSHCTSVRCSLHRGRAPVCSDVSCTAPPSPSCLLGACPQHCNHHQCVRRAPRRVTPSRPPRVRVCRLQSCSELVHAECSSGYCTLHCSSAHCQFHATPNGSGAGLRRATDP